MRHINQCNRIEDPDINPHKIRHIDQGNKPENPAIILHVWTLNFFLIGKNNTWRKDYLQKCLW